MDISELVIKVSTDGVEKADRATSKLTATAGKLVAAFAAVAAGAGAVGFALHKIVEVTSEAEKAQARLRAVGIQSAKDVKEVFDILEEMSSKPPFGLEETTEAFVKLVNQGLDPSKKALEAYSDLAVGVGSSLTGVVDAIAMAANGQYRSLVQFGVKATQEMDGLVVTFRGNTEKIKGDAASIEQYMQKVAAQNFLGAAAAVADTMGGKLDMLKDSWDDVWRAVSDSGIGQAIKDSLDMATAALAELEAEIRSGQLEGYLVAIAEKFTPFAQAASDAFNFVSEVWSKAMDGLGADTDSALGFIVHAFTELPENVTAVVKGIGATFGMLVEYATATGQGVYDAIVGYLKLAYESAANFGKLIWEIAKGPFRDKDAFANLLNSQMAATETFAATVSGAWDQTTKHIGFATDAWGEVVTEIMDERDAALQGFKDKTAAADAEREAWDKLQASRKAAREANDPLSAQRKSRGNTVSEESRQLFESLRQGLLLEEDAVRESYAKRLQLVRDNTIAGSEERIALEKALAEREAVELAAAHEATASRLQEEYSAQQSILQAALDTRQLSEAQYQEKSLANWNSYMSKLGQISTVGTRMVTLKTLEMHQQVLGYAASISDQMSGLVEGNNAAAKAMFVASKAIAIAQAIVNTELAATKALAEGGMYAGIPMSTIIRAAGYASVALMTATAVQEFQGKFEHGGMIGAGRVGLVGEAGPELVRGPAVVTSARSTADSGQGRSSNTQVNVHNYSGGEVQTQEREQPDGTKVIDVIVQRVQSELASSVARGVGPFVKSLQATYPLNRGARP